VAVEYEVALGSGRHATLRVPDNASLPLVARDFCQAQQAGHTVECAHVLAEALSRDRPRGGEGVTEGDEFHSLRARNLREFREGRGVLLFLHLKKCGGMTVQRTFLEQLAPGAVVHADEDMRWFFNHADKVNWDWRRVRLVGAAIERHLCCCRTPSGGVPRSGVHGSWRTISPLAFMCSLPLGPTCTLPCSASPAIASFRTSSTFGWPRNGSTSVTSR
jgi:hypothetical protein